MMLISNGICQHERNGALRIFFRKTRSVMIPRFAFFFQESWIRVKEISVKIKCGVKMFEYCFDNVRYKLANDWMVYKVLGQFMSEVSLAMKQITKFY